MGLLDGRKALIFGVANHRSLAWGIAQAMASNGAEIGLSYGIPQLERRVMPLAESIGASFVSECNVASDDDISRTFEEARAHFGNIDILVHSIAYAPQAELEGRFSETSRSGFASSMDISAYSLIPLAREGAKLMNGKGSIMTMTYYGSEKVVPHYNVMAVAKAALEASVRYLAADLGPEGIRVNAISAGPVKTLAAAGIAGFRKMLRYSGERTPLRRNIETSEVADTALWLGSDLSSGVTGEVIHVDAGYHVLGMPEPPENWK